MKASLKNILGLAALGMSLLTTTLPTWAGSVSAPEVYVGINSNGPFARGSMVGARYSADNRQKIGCSIGLFSESFGPTVACYALNSTNEGLQCTSTAPKHLEAVQAMTDSSYLYLEMDRNGQCRVVAISDGSSLLK